MTSDDNLYEVTFTTHRYLIAMLTDLNNRNLAVNFTINSIKTKFMRSEDVSQDRLVVGSDEIEKVKECVYLRRMVNMNRDIEAEISQRIRSIWKAFTAIKDLFNAMRENANLFNSIVLLATLYASETWLSQRRKNRLVTALRAMERSMLGISLR